MRTSEFDYPLPKELIAQTPVEPRDHSRLMILSRRDGSIEHRHFYDLPDYLHKGDVLVFNDSKVIPARIYGRKKETGGKVELLLLQRLSPGVWRSLTRPGRRMKAGTTFVAEGDDATIEGEVLDVEADGTRVVKLSPEEALDKVGVVPLPPYIRQPLQDAARYQTVYARIEGSVAAPTAGLHFTPGLLEGLRRRGVEFAFVTLHVGWDSFRPVKMEDPAQHELHREYWELEREAVEIINLAKAEGRRVISVGTTSVRLLEQAASLRPAGKAELTPSSGWADLFILPGYRFQMVDALITNFHLPRSTLLMLTCAFASRELIMRAYQEAIYQRYRLYSFGDAMMIS